MDNDSGFNGKCNYDFLQTHHTLLQLKIFELAFARFVWKGRNRYSFNRCFLILKGEGGICNHTGSQRLVMSAGNGYFMPPDLDLSFDFPPGLELLSIHFNAFLLPGMDVFARETKCMEFPVGTERLEEIRLLLEQAHGWESLCRFESVLWELLSKITLPGMDHFGSVPALQKRYGPLLLYIHNNISARTGIEELSAAAGIGRDTLSRHFSRDFGIPLKTFLMKELISVAERHLLGGDLPIREIARKLEFSSEYYFSSFFKRMKGISPTEFRSMRGKL